MLAQNFKMAESLDLTEAQRDALIKTLVLLETEKLQYEPFNDDWPLSDFQAFTGHFNMASWVREAPCGTVACIGGTAELLGAKNLAVRALNNHALSNLFEPQDIPWREWADITSEQAATALRSYLTTGDARWDLAVA